MGGDGWGDQPAWVYEITWEWEPQPGQRYPGDPGRRKAEYTPVYEASGHDARRGTSSSHDEGRAPQGGYSPGRSAPQQQGHPAAAPRREEPLWNRPGGSLPEQRGDEQWGRGTPDEHRGRSTPDQRRSAPVYGRQAEPPAGSYRDAVQHREGQAREGGQRPPQHRPTVPINPGHGQPGPYPPAGRTAPVSPGSAPGGRATPVSPASPGVYGAARPAASGPYYGRRQSPDETQPVSPAAGVYGSARPAPADAFPSRPGARPAPGQRDGREDAPFDLRPAPPERGTPAQSRPAPQPTRVTPARPDQPAPAYPAPTSSPIPPQPAPPQPVSPQPPQPMSPQWAQPAAAQPVSAQPQPPQPVSPQWAQPAATQQPVSAQPQPPQPVSPQWAQPAATQQPVSAQPQQPQPVSPQWAQPAATQPISAQPQPVSPQWVQAPAVQPVSSKPVSPYPAQAQPPQAPHPAQPAAPAGQSSAAYQASAPPSAPTSARPDHTAASSAQPTVEPQAAEAPRRGSIWDRPAPSEAAVESRPQPVSAVPASAPPSPAAGNDEPHGLGWLLSQSGLGAVTPLPPPTPQAAAEPPVAHPVSVEPVIEPISPAPVSSQPADVQPTDAPADAEPVDAEPADVPLAATEPVDVEPADAEPAESLPAADENASPLEPLADDARPVSGAPERQDWFAPSGAQPIVVLNRPEKSTADLDDTAHAPTGEAPAQYYDDLPYTNYEEPLAVQTIAVTTGTPAPVEPVSAQPDEAEPIAEQPVPHEQWTPVEPVSAQPDEAEPIAEQPVPHEQWTPVEPVSAQPVPLDYADEPAEVAAPVDQPEPMQPISAPPFLAEPVSAQPYVAETPLAEPEPVTAWPAAVEPVSVAPSDDQSVVDEPAIEEPGPPVADTGPWDDDRPAVEFHAEAAADDVEPVEAELLEFETAAGERVVVHAYQAVSSIDIVEDAELVDDDRRESVAALEAPTPALAITAEPDPEPIAPITEPLEPVEEPFEPVAEPVEPIAEPVKPIAEPVEPIAEPIEPVAEPIEPIDNIADQELDHADDSRPEPIEDAEPGQEQAQADEIEDEAPAETQPASAAETVAPQEADDHATEATEGETREPSPPAYEIRTEPIRQRREQRADARSRRDPEQILAAYPVAFDPRTLREQIEDEEPMWVVIDRLTDKLEYAERDTDRARLLSLRAVASRLLGDLDPALEDAREALVHAEKAQDLVRTATVRARLAHVLHWRAEYAEADKIYAEADSPELPSRLRAEINELAGRSAFEQGRYLEAVNHLEHALDLRKGSDPDLVERIELALDTIRGRTTEGWGPYPRTREEILGSSEPSRPLREETTGLFGYPGLMPPTFAQAQPFADGVAWVRRPEAPAWELAGLTGELLIDASAGYRAAGRFADGLAWVSRDDAGGWFAVDKQNRVIVPGGFEDARPFHNGLALVRRGGWGAVDQHGRVVVQPHYRAFATMLFGGEPVDGFTEEGLAVVDAGEVYGVVDRAGKLLVPPTHAALLIHPSAFLVADKFGLWGALNRAGEPLVELKYQDRNDVLERIDELVTDPRPVL